MPRAPRHRSFVFTLNNYTDNDLDHLRDEFAADARIAAGTPHIKYLCFGKEVSTGGTPHLQGFVQFKRVKPFDFVKKVISPRAHLEVAHAGPYIAAGYCKKGKQSHEEWEEFKMDGPNYGLEADVTEYGEAPVSDEQRGQDEKTRFETAYALAKEGDLEEIDKDILVRYYSTLKKIKTEHQVLPEQMDVLDFHWYTGPSGTGKSRKANLENPGAYRKNVNKWWDGYDGQSCVIIEEWSPHHHVLANHLKVWLDHYPFSAETKGGHVCIRPPRVIITSNYTVEECFPLQADHEPLLRRLQVTQF